MTSLKCKGFIFWLLLFFINLTNCESPIPEIKVDYTGQKGTIKDIDSNTYKTIGIGTQIWMAENLATTRINNGTLISQIKNDSIWSLPWNRQPSYCTYNNDSGFYRRTYGLLYNYFAVKTRLLCPVGWHVPSKADWDTLIQFAGGNKVAGGKLKDMQSSLWIDSHGFEENYDFKALPGGLRQFHGGKFNEIGSAAYWWTADSVNPLQANAVSIRNSDTNAGVQPLSNRYGFNIRCIKNK
jgi:uncharacterized protein (TIGR02145 family)